MRSVPMLSSLTARDAKVQAISTAANRLSPRSKTFSLAFSTPAAACTARSRTYSPVVRRTCHVVVDR